MYLSESKNSFVNNVCIFGRRGYTHKGITIYNLICRLNLLNIISLYQVYVNTLCPTFYTFLVHSVTLQKSSPALTPSSKQRLLNHFPFLSTFYIKMLFSSLSPAFVGRSHFSFVCKKRKCEVAKQLDYKCNVREIRCW